MGTTLEKTIGSKSTVNSAIQQGINNIKYDVQCRSKKKETSQPNAFHMRYVLIECWNLVLRMPGFFIATLCDWIEKLALHSQHHK